MLGFIQVLSLASDFSVLQLLLRDGRRTTVPFSVTNPNEQASVAVSHQSQPMSSVSFLSTTQPAIPHFWDSTQTQPPGLGNRTYIFLFLFFFFHSQSPRSRARHSRGEGRGEQSSSEFMHAGAETKITTTLKNFLHRPHILHRQKGLCTDSPPPPPSPTPLEIYDPLSRILCFLSLFSWSFFGLTVGRRSFLIAFS